jgi:CRISPR/Cas system-associated exonuclease Cas4 (RecB family)
MNIKVKLPPDFQFSQGSLQDFVDCRQRFFLRYIRRLAWPAIETEPVLENERWMQQGALFHRLVQQAQLGVPADQLLTYIQGEDLERWWDNFKTCCAPLINQAEGRFVELSLTAALGLNRITAKFDLVLRSASGQATIFDWKTSAKHPQRQWLERRLQTIVYPWLLIQAGSSLNQGTPFLPEQIEMVYWFTHYPQEPERFPYDQAHYAADTRYLVELADTIHSLPESGYTLTADERKCRYCIYRSLCDRGVQSGDINDIENGEQDDLMLALDFDQVEEIPL